MSNNICTIADIPGVRCLLLHGRVSRAEIIEAARAHYTYIKEQAEKVLAATDADFEVRVVNGVYKQKLIEILSHEGPTA